MSSSSAGVVNESSHPLILHKITQMRKATNTPKYLNQLMKEVSTFLCYEGAEKVWGKITGHGGHAVPAAAAGPDAERFMVTGAIRTRKPRARNRWAVSSPRHWRRWGWMPMSNRPGCAGAMPNW